MHVLRAFLSASRGSGTTRSPANTAIEERFSSNIADRLGKWSFFVHCSNQPQVIGWCSEEKRNWQLGGCNVHAVENWLLLGSSMGAPVTKAELEVVLQKTIKELSETIKAVIESKLGDLGSAGVQSLEEFSKKVRTAMGQLDESITSCEVAAVQVQPPVVSSPVPVEVPGSPFALSGPASEWKSVRFRKYRLLSVACGPRCQMIEGPPHLLNLVRKSQKIMGGVLVIILRSRHIHVFFLKFRANVLLVLARVKKVKILKPSYFVSEVVGTFVGFPRHKRVVDGFARCLLCKADLSIAGRGLSSLWEHWRGVEHTRLEQKYRIMMQMPLLDKACRRVTAQEDRRIRQDRMNEPPVYLESELSLSVDERIATEEAEAPSSERPALSAESVSFLWLGQFVSSFVNATSFGAVMRMVESWRDNMSTELRVECRSLPYPRCQVCM